MVDINGKIKKIIKLIEEGEYFVINRPRQYGKTTMLYMLVVTRKSLPNVIHFLERPLGYSLDV